MTTVSAKELRENLSDILRRSEAGEVIEVIYRSRPVVRISPIKKQASRNVGAQVGRRLDVIMKELPHSISPMMQDPTKDYKQLREELYRRDSKYRRYLSPKTIDE